MCISFKVVFLPLNWCYPITVLMLVKTIMFWHPLFWRWSQFIVEYDQIWVKNYKCSLLWLLATTATNIPLMVVDFPLVFLNSPPLPFLILLPIFGQLFNKVNYRRSDFNYFIWRRKMSLVSLFYFNSIPKCIFRFSSPAFLHYCFQKVMRNAKEDFIAYLLTFYICQIQSDISGNKTCLSIWVFRDSVFLGNFNGAVIQHSWL